MTPQQKKLRIKMYKFLDMEKSGFQRKNKNFTWKVTEIEKLAEEFKMTLRAVVELLRM